MKKKSIKTVIFIVLILLFGVKQTYAIETNIEDEKTDDIQVLESQESEKTSETPLQTIEEGYYIIKSALNKNKVLDIDKISKENEANIQLWDKNQGTNQIFELIYDNKTNTYKIKSALSGKVFDLYGARKENCTNVELYTDNNVNWQKWEIVKTSDNYYSIKSVHSGLYLDVEGNISANGTNIEVYSANGQKNQKFIFEKVKIPKNNIKIDNGFYQIKSMSNLNIVMDVLGASKVDKATVRNVSK